MDDRVEAPSEGELLGAFEALRECVCDGTSLKGKRRLADIFISCDEAHPLAIPWDHNSGLSNYIELGQALHLSSGAPLFASFLSTNGKITLFVPPRTRIFQGNFCTPHPVIELEFDQPMCNRKILHKYKALEQVTSLECIAHMGRPL